MECIRDSQWQSIDSSRLVPGDIIKVSAREMIPADLILFHCNEMRVNHSNLTGEQENLLRDATIRYDNIFESPNVAFNGTMCAEGYGTGMVFRIGDDSVMGRIKCGTEMSSSQIKYAEKNY